MTFVLASNTAVIADGHEGDARNALRYVQAAYPGEGLFVIRNRDLFSIAAMAGYMEICKEHSTPEMVAQVEQHIRRFEAWQEENPCKLKQPDPYPGWVK